LESHPFAIDEIFEQLTNSNRRAECNKVLFGMAIKSRLDKQEKSQKAMVKLFASKLFRCECGGR
jgi:hypothetical protein